MVMERNGTAYLQNQNQEAVDLISKNSNLVIAKDWFGDSD